MDEGYTCTKCRELLPINMFRSWPTAMQGVRRDAWCLDCRGERRSTRASRRGPVSRAPARPGRNARNRAATTAGRMLREAYPERYEQYRAQAQARHPLPEGYPERARVMALHARRAIQRLRADYAQEYRVLFARALRHEGVEAWSRT